MVDTQLSMDRLYAETCGNIRATDDISFKLIGLVPLVSGAALMTLFLKEIPEDKAGLVVALALFAALVTLGLFRWELRNIQTCSWLLRRAEALEAAHAQASALPRPAAPQGIGKSESEKAIYCVTIFAWLAMPLLLGCPLDDRWLAVYAGAALVIAVLTIVSALAKVHVEPDAAHSA